MTEQEVRKGRLEDLLAGLAMRRRRISEDLAEPLDPDSSERAVEMEDDASLEGQAMLLDREIASVRRSLERIRNGSYGICVLCGDGISPARLDARPEAALCIRCAREQD